MISNRFVAPLVVALGIISSVVSAQPAASADYQAVTSKLDAGGSYFMYMETRGSAESIEGFFDKTLQAPNAEIRRLMGLVRSGGRVLGLYSLEALGASEMPLPDGGARKKSYLLMGKPEGLFTLIGRPAGPMDIAKLAPADVAAASVTSVNFDRILPLIKLAATTIAGADGDSAINEVLLQAKQQGVDIEAILASLHGETLFWLRLDDADKVSDPEEGGQMTHARPGAVLALRTRNSVVFDTLKQMAAKNPDVITLSKSANRAEILLVQGAKLGNPLLENTVIAHHENLLIVATSPGDLRLAEEAAKSTGLFDSPAFKKVATGMPAAPSTMSFISPRVRAFVKDLMVQVEGKADNPAVTEWAGAITDMVLPGKDGLAMWTAWDADGVLMVQQGDKVGMRMTQSNVAVAGMVVAIAVPAFVRARENSRGRLCQENLSKLDGAKEQWALEFLKSSGAKVTMDDLVRQAEAPAGQGYLRHTPGCPSGGTYELNAIGVNPTCSIGNSNKPFMPHVLP